MITIFKMTSMKVIKQLQSYLVALFGGVIMWGCVPYTNGHQNVFTLNEESITFTAEGGSEAIIVYSSNNWEITSECDWCTPSIKSGEPNEFGQAVIFTATATQQARNTEVWFQSGNTYVKLEVNQLGTGDTPDMPNPDEPLDDGSVKIGDITTPGTYKVKDVTVLAVYKRGFLIGDSTGKMIVFDEEGTNCNVGDVVSVEGTTIVWGGFMEFKGDLKIEKSGVVAVSHGEARTIGVDDIAAYVDKPTIEYVTYTGTLHPTFDSSMTTVNLNYFEVEVGENAKILIQYPIDTDLLTSLVGKKVVVRGYLIGTNTSKTNVYTMLTSVEEVADNSVKIGTITSAGTYKVSNAAVLATHTRGFVMGDDTGEILVYLGQNPNCQVGDVVTVEGPVVEYDGIWEFNTLAEVTTVGTTTIVRGNPEKLDGAGLDALLANPEIKYISYTGVLSANGSSYNIAVSGAASAIGHIIFPTDATAMDSWLGKTVTVTGYSIGSNNGKYVQTMLTPAEGRTTR